MNDAPSTTNRIKFLSLAILCGALIVVADLYYIQIVRGDSYREKGDRQYVRPTAAYDRGSIFFTAKDGVKVTAAGIKDGYTLSIIPKYIKDPQAVFDELTQFVSLNKADFFEKVARKDDPYEEIAKRLDRETGQKLAERITEKDLEGVRVVKDTWRVYPANGLAAHTVGFVGYKGDEIAGRYGLESFYESTLKRNGETESVNFFAEIFSGIKSRIFDGDHRKGDVVTTIEPSVQSYIESQLEKVKSEWKSDTVGAIVMDPKTGAIYSMAALPDFNPNDRSADTDPLVYSNPLVENAYEMGSILKALTMAAGLDAGVITPRTTYDDKGWVEIDGKKISNYDGKGRGVVPMQVILNDSLNTGIAFIVDKLGDTLMGEYFQSMGLSEKSGIDQPNEATGINSLASNRHIDLVSSGFGQSIATTPIQIVRALAVLANGGMLVTPHLTDRIEFESGLSKKVDLPEPVRVIRKESAEEITRMLVTVVDTALKKGAYKNEHYTLAAKTGTAQIADRVNGGYYKDRYLHSFFGYFPAYNPKFLVFLYQVHPRGADYASETLTVPFMNIAKFLITYYEIPPDR